MKHKTRIFVLIIGLSAAILPLSAQDSGGYITGTQTGDFLFANVAATGPAGFGICANFITLGILSGDGSLTPLEMSLASSLTETSNISLFVSGADDIPLAAGIPAGLLGLEILSSAYLGNDSSLTTLAYWGKLDLAMYRLYDGYASARLQSQAWDNRTFRKYTLPELYSAPFDPALLTNPWVLGAIGSGLAGYALTLFFSGQNDADAVWKTGNCYWDGKPVSPLEFTLYGALFAVAGSVNTGVGEESMYRGWLLEELSYHMGPEWGSIVDASLFTLMHVITDIVRQESVPYIIAHSTGVFLSDFMMNLAWEKTGLRGSVAAHSWIDILAQGVNIPLTGGVSR